MRKIVIPQNDTLEALRYLFRFVAPGKNAKAPVLKHRGISKVREFMNNAREAWVLKPQAGEGIADLVVFSEIESPEDLFPQMDIDQKIEIFADIATQLHKSEFVWQLYKNDQMRILNHLKVIANGDISVYKDIFSRIPDGDQEALLKQICLFFKDKGNVIDFAAMHPALGHAAEVFTNQIFRKLGHGIEFGNEQDYIYPMLCMRVYWMLENKPNASVAVADIFPLVSSIAKYFFEAADTRAYALMTLLMNACDDARALNYTHFLNAVAGQIVTAERKLPIMLNLQAEILNFKHDSAITQKIALIHALFCLQVMLANDCDARFNSDLLRQYLGQLEEYAPYETNGYHQDAIKQISTPELSYLLPDNYAAGAAAPNSTPKLGFRSLSFEVSPAPAPAPALLEQPYGKIKLRRAKAMG